MQKEIQAIEDALIRERFFPNERRIILYFVESSGDHNSSEIQEKLDMNQTIVSQTLNRLIKRNTLVRDKQKREGVYGYLTYYKALVSEVPTDLSLSQKKLLRFLIDNPGEYRREELRSKTGVRSIYTYSMQLEKLNLILREKRPPSGYRDPLYNYRIQEHFLESLDNR